MHREQERHDGHPRPNHASFGDVTATRRKPWSCEGDMQVIRETSRKRPDTNQIPTVVVPLPHSHATWSSRCRGFDRPGEDPVNDSGDSLEMNREHERHDGHPQDRSRLLHRRYLDASEPGGPAKATCKGIRVTSKKATRYQARRGSVGGTRMQRRRLGAEFRSPRGAPSGRQSAALRGEPNNVLCQDVSLSLVDELTLPPAPGRWARR